MQDEELAAAPSTVFKVLLKEVRKRRGWSQAQLAERVTELGMPMARVTVVKTEAGDRKVTLDEVFAFAAALDVAPLHLILPRKDYSVAITPARRMGADRAREWFRGNDPFGGIVEDVRTYYSEIPDHEWRVREAMLADPAVIEDLQRIYDQQREEGEPDGER